MVSIIHLSMVLEISVLNEKSPSSLWEKLEKIYMSKSLTNRLYLKKQLCELKIDKQIDVRDHINKFNKCIIQLLSIGIRLMRQIKLLFYWHPYAFSWKDNVDCG